MRRALLAMLAIAASCRTGRHPAAAFDVFLADSIEQSAQRTTLDGYIYYDCPVNAGPVPYVDVVILDATTGKMVARAQSDRSGRFSIRSEYLEGDKATAKLRIRFGGITLDMPGVADMNFVASLPYPCDAQASCPGYPEGIAAHDGSPLERSFLRRTLERCPGFRPAVDRLARLDRTDAVATSTAVAVAPPAPIQASKAAREIVETLSSNAAGIDVEVWFDFDSARVGDASLPQVEQVARALEHPGLAGRTLVIGGHADGMGSTAYNQQLSLRRAEGVRRLLIERFGAAPDRLTTVGYGESAPLETNETTSGRAKNRRVTLTLGPRAS